MKADLSKHGQSGPVTSPPRQAVEAFLALLEDEQRALVRCDALGIEDFLERKLTLAQQLSALDGRALEAAADADLRGKIMRARILNDMNGKLIGMQLAHFRQQLATLTRHAQPSNVYGADGLAERSVSNRALGVG